MRDLQRSRVLALFVEAEALPPAQRLRFCRERCADDAEVQRELELLLDADASRAAFLDAPLFAVDLEACFDDAERHDPERSLADSEALLGRAIGPFTLVGLLGEGGMGAVYHARQTAPVRRDVALKLVRPGFDHARVTRRFEAERDALARMQHPGIARIYEAGATKDGKPWFAMELVRGDDLVEYCRSRGLGIADRLELFCEVCDAVQHAHHKGIIHRDLKPSNVLVSDDGPRPQPKVIDFGIARATEAPLADATLTRANELVGTPAYMSPEQLAASDDVDSRSDIYALGVLLYELLTGRPPFVEDKFATRSAAEVLRILRERPPTLPSKRVERDADPDRRSLARGLRGDLDAIVTTALRFERVQRYASASELAADLRRHLAHEPVLATAPGLGYRLRKYARRNRVALTAAALIVGSLTAGLVLAAHYAVTARDESASKDRALAAATMRMEALYDALEMWQARANAAGEVMPLVDQLTPLRTALADTVQPGLGAYFDEHFKRDALLPVERRERSHEYGAMLLAVRGVEAESARARILSVLLGECAFWLSFDGLGAEAEPYLARALELRAENSPADPVTLRYSAERSGSLIAAGRAAEALEQTAAALADLEARGFARVDAAPAVYLERRAAALLALGHLEDAAAALDEAQPALEELLPQSLHWMHGLATRVRLEEARADEDAAAAARRQLAQGRSAALRACHATQIELALGPSLRSIWEALIALRSAASGPANDVERSLARLRTALASCGVEAGSPEARLVAAFVGDLALALGEGRGWHDDEAFALARQAEGLFAPGGDDVASNSYPEVALALAQALLERGAFADAEQRARRGLAAMPLERRSIPLVELELKSVAGRALVGRGELDAAEPFLVDAYRGLVEQWAARDQDIRQTFRALLEVCWDRGRLHEAEAALGEQEAWTGDARALTLLGQAQLEHGLGREAVASFARALDLDPASDAARRGAARAAQATAPD